MNKLKFSIDLRYEIHHQTSDFIINIHAAKTQYQTVMTESLELSQSLIPEYYSDSMCGTRFMRFNANPGPLTIRYTAIVELNHHFESPGSIRETPVSLLPTSVLSYIYPSRYCQSDRLRNLATREFGHLPQGYSRVLAIQHWVRERTTFLSGSSNASTSAVDTLIEQVGVCRDYAHLMIAICRALNIPARFVTGIDYGADPAMGPTDFHAYVEVYLDNFWYLFEPSGVSPPMGLVRIGTGRDAADVSFATIFGHVSSAVPLIKIQALDDPANGYFEPTYCVEAMSTMVGML